jgi:ornithine cyclodeaminase
MPLILSEADVRAVLTMRDLIDAMETALAQFAAGATEQPLRTILPVRGSDGGLFGVMPASLADPPAVGAKLVTLFHGNTARGIPTHLASIVLLDHVTGALTALMDGRYITEARTAAVSAVSARLLAREDAGRLAILGSGVQARSHLEAIPCVRPIRDIRVWSPNPESRDRFVREMAGTTAADLHAVDSAELAARDADIVVTVTAAVRPVLMDAWVKPGAHVVAVGACRPNQQELDPDLVTRGRLFVDSRTGALAESGDVLIPMAAGRFGPDHIAAELGALIRTSGRGRTSADEVTIFKSLGMAVEDVAAARLVHERARARGIGVEVPI